MDFTIDHRNLDATIEQLIGTDISNWISAINMLTPSSSFSSLTDNWVVTRIEELVRQCGTHESDTRLAQFDRTLAWDAAVQSGRSYMVGDDVSMSSYLKSHRSKTTPWQRFAAWMVWEHGGKCLDVRVSQPRREYQIYRRGEYVEICLPHHDAGGERVYVTRAPFKSKILVNVD